MNDEYKCPLCGRPGERSARYPRYICVECGHRATDATGRGLKFSNVALSGGFEARYRDTGEIYESGICYVDGRKCLATEAHMGGIVVSIYGDAANEKE